jgi:hypothetical protein
VGKAKNNISPRRHGDTEKTGTEQPLKPKRKSHRGGAEKVIADIDGNRKAKPLTTKETKEHKGDRESRKFIAAYRSS